jgi:uncharacterized protein
MTPSPDLPGPLELLVLQPTPFCNLDCSYCYLPDRQSTKRMSAETLERTLDWVFSSGLVREPFTVLWHAGEPLVVPPPFYEATIAGVELHNRNAVPVTYSVQTNATLIDAEWCAFFRRHGIQPGVSVDGPAFLHDRHRLTRSGKGTFDRVLHGIRLLNEHDIPYFVITVLTADSLDCPDELFAFYREYRVQSVCFNVEEIEGPHTTSSLRAEGTEERFRRFLTRFLELAGAADPPLPVREFETFAAAVRGYRFGPGGRTQENRPWGILNVDCDGNFSTYSPELLGVPSPRHGGFVLGNVARDRLEDVVASDHFRRLEEEVGRGVTMCEETCSYFAFCGGGAPANKFFENGSFASTETMSCRLHKMACVDVALDRLERLERRRAAEEVRRFGLPGALLDEWRSLLEQDPERLPGFDAFAGRVGAYLSAAGFSLPPQATFEVVISAPGQEAVSWETGAGALWGGVNLGDEAATVVAADGPDRLRLKPGEGFSQPDGAGTVRGCTLDRQEPDVFLLIRRPCAAPKASGGCQPPEEAHAAALSGD